MSQESLSKLNLEKIKQQQQTQENNEYNQHDISPISKISDFFPNQQFKSQNYQISLLFSPQITENQLLRIQKVLQSHHFFVKRLKQPKTNKEIMIVGLTYLPMIYQAAEKLNIKKPPIDLKEEEKNFFHNKKGISIMKVMSQKTVELLDKINPRIRIYEQRKLVTLKTLDQLYLYYKNQQEELPDNKSENKDNKQEEDKLLTNITETNKKNEIQDQLFNYFTPAQQIRITHHCLFNIQLQDLKIIEYIQQQNLLEGCFALHDSNYELKLKRKSIENYYGENISIYFEFAEFYYKWLYIPGIIGLAAYILDEMYPLHHQISFFAYFYSFTIIIWLTLFIKYWQRKEKEISLRLGTLGRNIDKTDRNPDFKGFITINAATGLTVEYYPKKRRFFFYILSAIEAIPLLVLTTYIKLSIFNISGLVDDKKSMFYFPSIAELNQPGGLLYGIPYINGITNFVAILVVFKMNLFYVEMAKISTKRENHKTNYSFHNSLVIKRFIFEFISRFSHFFYIGFVSRDLDKLKDILFTLFLMDEFRKIVSETIIPIILKKMSKSHKERKQNKKKMESEKNINIEIFEKDKIGELTLWEYEDFDDYIEVIFQIVHITFFAAIFPLASTMSVIFNFFENYSDKYKLAQKLYIRNIPTKVQGIGQWILILNFISIACIYSNLTITGFSSYEWYKENDQNNGQMQHIQNFKEHFDIEIMECETQIGCLWEHMGISLFIYEHIIILAVLIIRLSIKNYPKWVSIYLERKNNNSKNLL